MSEIKPPCDVRGNELQVGDIVTVVFRQPPLFKIIAIENGGIHLAHGITTAIVRCVCDMLLRQMPGIPFDSIIKTVEPSTVSIIEKIVEGSTPT